MFRKLMRSVLALVMVGTVCVGFAVATPGTAGALCVENPIEGDWHNIDADTRAMTRVVVETCQPVTTCRGDICTTVFDSGTFVSPYGSCHPTDCEWGRELGERMADGWVRVRYDFGFKRSDVWVKTYEYWGLTYLRVWVNNDFTAADGRADYTTDEWFLR